MEVTTSGNVPTMLDILRALARHSASLLVDGQRCGRIEQLSDGRQRAPLSIAARDVEHLITDGLVRQTDAAHWVISRRGITTLRSALNRAAAASAQQTGASARQASPRRTPSAEPRRGPDAKPAVNDRESPLAWLRQRRDKDGKPMIGDSEYLAGEQLRADFERAQLGQRVTASWDPTARSSGSTRGTPGSGLEMAESTVAARQRVDAALKTVGPELSGLLLDVCCFLQGLEQAERNRDWPRRSGKIVLQLALAHLARHYGFDQAGRTCASKVRSWGAPDYRPCIDSGEAALNPAPMG